MKKLKLFSVFLLLAPFVSAQTTITITPDKDNTIYAESTNSNGVGKLYAGQTCSDRSRRALLHFDIADTVPIGATITAVSLTLNVDNVSPTADGIDNYTLNAVTKDWGEGTSSGGGAGATAIAPDANWNDAMLGTSAWTVAGGDFVATPSATTGLPNADGSYVWTDPIMVSDVAGWLADPSTNFGWILRGEEGETCSARRFGSKDQGTAPVLEITYECTGGAPTALCKSINLYLDEAGDGVISDADLDNGSTAVCGGDLAFSASQTSFSCADIFDAPTPPSLVLTGAYDGSLTGGTPKGIELYVINDIPDLSIYGVGSANNGGGTDGEEFTFPAESATAGTYIYVATDSTRFEEWFGFYPNYNSGAMNINGDDAIELFMEGEVIDVFGQIAVDGTGQPWEYLDGWAYRLSNTGPDGTVFDLSNWTFSGPNEWDGEVANATADSPLAVGTFSTPPTIGTSVTLTVTDEDGATATCATTVVVLDTLAPTMSCVGTYSLALDASGSGTITAADLDAGTTDGCGAVSISLSVTTFTCADVGENEVMLYAEDSYGNRDSCAVTVTVDDDAVITLTADEVAATSCFDSSDGFVLITVTGGTPDYVFDWDNDGTGDTDDLEDLTSIPAGDYSVAVTDANGCNATETFTITSPAEITIAETITNEACAGNSDGAIAIDVVGGVAPYSFNWSNGETTEDIDELSADDYVLVITDANSCTNNFDLTVELENEIDTTISTITDPVFQFTANQEDATYQWVTCPDFEVIDGETNQTYTPTTNGSYAVIITKDGCQDTSSCVPYLFDGIERLNGANFSIYPNPSAGSLIIELDELEEDVFLNIINLNGQKVISTLLYGKLTKIDLEELENGTYFAEIVTSNWSTLKKITVFKE